MFFMGSARTASVVPPSHPTKLRTHEGPQNATDGHRCEAAPPTRMLAKMSPRVQPLDEHDPESPAPRLQTPPGPSSGEQQPFSETMDEQWPGPDSPPKTGTPSFHNYDDDDEAKDPDDVFGPLRNRASALRGAAENGDASAQVRLGYMYVDIGARQCSSALQFGVSRGRSEVLLSGYGRVYLSEIA